MVHACSTIRAGAARGCAGGVFAGAIRRHAPLPADGHGRRLRAIAGPGCRLPRCRERADARHDHAVRGQRRHAGVAARGPHRSDAGRREEPQLARGREDHRRRQRRRRRGAGRASGPSLASIVPPFELRDQNDRPVTMRGFAGRVLVVTFIYTRCPLPDFCPLMVRNLETVRRRAHEEGIGSRLALLGVTLDPAFDTPAVLRAYGESVLKSANRFEQWTLATGTPAQIEEVAQFFGVTARAEAGLVTHTLSTAVVGHDGRIMRLFASNSWRPDELYDVVRLGVERSACASERISTAEASMEEWNRRRFISSDSHRGRQRPCRVERLRLTRPSRAGAATRHTRRDSEPRRGERRRSACR